MNVVINMRGVQRNRTANLGGCVATLFQKPELQLRQNRKEHFTV
jgi:hypothetical protein